MDYSKAFDHVDHTTAINQMVTLGVIPILLKWMHSLLDYPHMKVATVGLMSLTHSSHKSY
jgi:hypothetical protein